MTYQDFIINAQPIFTATLDNFKAELGKIRTGQAHPSLVEDIMIEIYGQEMPIKQVGSISCPERRQIYVQPWDTSTIPAIEKALQKASLGAFPVADGKGVRLTLPTMTQEYRQSLIKIVSEKAEQLKQAIRHQREDCQNKIQDAAKAGDMREDDKFKGKEELQKAVDAIIAKIDEAVTRKQEEINS